MFNHETHEGHERVAGGKDGEERAAEAGIFPPRVHRDARRDSRGGNHETRAGHEEDSAGAQLAEPGLGDRASSTPTEPAALFVSVVCFVVDPPVDLARFLVSVAGGDDPGQRAGSRRPHRGRLQLEPGSSKLDPYRRPMLSRPTLSLAGAQLAEPGLGDRASSTPTVTGSRIIPDDKKSPVESTGDWLSH